MSAPSSSLTPPFHAVCHDVSALVAAVTSLQKLLKTQARPDYIEFRPTGPMLRVRASTRTWGIEHILDIQHPKAKPFFVEAGQLLKALRACSSSSVKLLVANRRLTLTTHETFECSIPIVDEDTASEMGSPWPEREKIRTTGTIDADIDFGSLIAKARTHACTDEARIQIYAIVFVHDGQAGHFVATDGHRMVVLRRQFEFPPIEPIQLPVDLRLPIKTRLTLTMTGTKIFFESDVGTTWATSRQGVTFPDYKAVIPRAFTEKGCKSVSVDYEALLQTAKGFKAIADRQRPPVLLEPPTDRHMRFCTRPTTPESGEIVAERVLDCRGGLRPPDPLAINPNFLLDALDVVQSERVHFFWEGRIEPLVMSTSDRSDVVVIMPMRF